MTTIVGFAVEGASSRRWFAAAGLAGAVALAYSNSLGVPFLFDDVGAVVNNPTIRRLDSLAVFTPPADGSTTTGRPFVNLSFALNYALSGEHAWSYHAFNIAIHALAALTLMSLVRRTLTLPALRARFGAAAGPLALLIASLWALHPLQTESVVCIAQRTESLCGLFYLLTLYAFVRANICHPIGDNYRPSRPRGECHLIGDKTSSRLAGTCHLMGDKLPPPRSQATWLAVSVTACLAGMATKEVTATAPLLVLLYDRTFMAGSFAGAWRQRRGYYLALAGTWLLLAWLLWSGGGARGASAGFGLGVSWWAYLLQQAEAGVLYLKLAIWPHPLVLDYGTAVAQSLADVWWQGVVVFCLLVFAFWTLFRKPAAGFLGAWFFVILAPSSSIVPLVTQTMAEHRVYLPLAAVVVPAVLAAHRYAGRRTLWWGAVVAIVFTGMTVVRNRDYRDAVAIWTDTVAKVPQNARAHNNLAWALQRAGRLPEALVHYAKAVALDPNYVTAYFNWGVALLDANRVEEAIACFESVVRRAPDHVDARVNLGNALVRARRAEDALSHYEAALRLQPGADVHFNLGIALAELERFEVAATQLQAALRLKPDLAEARYQLARLRERLGQLAEAERVYEETLLLAPNHVGTHRRLGLLCARTNRLATAAEHFRAVLRQLPADADAHANLGNVLLLQGRVRDAIAQYEEALRLRPDDVRTRENLQLARESVR